MKYIAPLLELLKKNINNDYEIKILLNDQVKIQLKTPEQYTTIVKELAEKTLNSTYTN